MKKACPCCGFVPRNMSQEVREAFEKFLNIKLAQGVAQFPFSEATTFIRQETQLPAKVVYARAWYFRAALSRFGFRSFYHYSGKKYRGKQLACIHGSDCTVCERRIDCLVRQPNFQLQRT